MSDICPVHGIPDCSPLLNGCSRLTADDMNDEPTAEQVSDEVTMIRTILREHSQRLGVCCRCGYGEGEQFAVSEHRHRAHVASVIADRLASARVQWEKETRERERKAWDEAHKECICHAQSFHAYKHHNPYREGDSDADRT